MMVLKGEQLEYRLLIVNFKIMITKFGIDNGTRTTSGVDNSKIIFNFNETSS